MYFDVEMPGGVTFFSEVITSELTKLHKLGCDYAHSWNYEDGGEKLQQNKVDWVLKDAQATIDALPIDLFFNES